MKQCLCLLNLENRQCNGIGCNLMRDIKPVLANNKKKMKPVFQVHLGNNGNVPSTPLMWHRYNPFMIWCDNPIYGFNYFTRRSMFAHFSDFDAQSRSHVCKFISFQNTRIFHSFHCLTHLERNNSPFLSVIRYKLRLKRDSELALVIASKFPLTCYVDDIIIRPASPQNEAWTEALSHGHSL